MAATSEDKQVLQTGDRPPKRRFTLYCCYKWLVFIHGLFFLVVGLLLLIVGLTVTTLRSRYTSINDLLASPTILAIIVGVVMVITAMVGILGAIKERLILLKIFLVIIILVFLFQVVIGIIAYVYREEAVTQVSHQMKFAVQDYHKDEYLAESIDAVQSDFQCCGLRGYRDWNNNALYQCGSGTDVECSVPDSCCRDVKVGCGKEIRRNVTTQSLLDHVQPQGCTRVFLVWLEQNLDLVGALALGFSLPQLCGIFLVAAFIIKVHDYRRLFNYRKYVYRK